MEEVVADREILEEFVQECTEMLDEAEPEMVSSSLINQDLANKIFRPLHSMKGVAGSFGLNTIAEVAHAAETFLSIFREESMESNDPKHLRIFLTAFDFFRFAFNQVLENSHDKGFEEKAAEIITLFEVATEEIISGNSENNQDQISEIKIEINDEMLQGFKSESNEAFDIIEAVLVSHTNGKYDESGLEEAFRHMHSFKGNCGIFALRDLETLSHRIESLLESITSKSIEPKVELFEILIKLVDVLRESVNEIKVGQNLEVTGLNLYLEMLEEHLKEPSRLQKNTQDEGTLQFHNTPQKVKKQAQQDIRVATHKLDTLNDLVGELVTAKTMAFENIRRISKSDNDLLEKAMHFLEKTITDIQDITMEIRMVPISGLFKKMVRVVHDLSRKSGKEINLQFFGEETEIDKTLLEKVSDPLVHMIRNSVDHGIEDSATRKSLDKESKGTITLGAKQESSEVWIIIKDDGKGLDREAIIKKASEQGIISGDSSQLSDEEVFQLIYRPGFSTAEKITDISGRGVGMDVVTQNIKDVKGRISIESTKGEGSTFTIKIPLTLAIIDGMLLKVGDVKYVLSVDSIQEIVKVGKEEIKTILDDQELISIRGELVPIVSLSKIHQHSNDPHDLESGVILVIHAHGHKIGLLIDELLGQQQTVVKPLSTYFKDIKGVSSCSILGNGEVSLILDVASLVELALQKVKQ